MKLGYLTLAAAAVLAATSAANASFITLSLQVQNPTTSAWVSALDVTPGTTYNYRIVETTGTGTGANKTVTTLTAGVDGLQSGKANLTESGADFANLTTVGALTATVWDKSPSGTKNGTGSETGIAGITYSCATSYIIGPSVVYSGTLTVKNGITPGTSANYNLAWTSGGTGGGKVNNGSLFTLSNTTEFGDSSTLAKTPAIAYQGFTLSFPVSEIIDTVWTPGPVTAPDLEIGAAADSAIFANAEVGSVKIKNVDGVGPIFVMVWLEGLEAAQAHAVAELADEAGYVAVGSPKFAEMQGDYGMFDVLFQLPAGDAGTFGWDLTGSGASVSKIAAVPEPASLGLLAIGAMGLLARKRK